MARDVREDFEELVEWVRTYGLRARADDGEFRALLSRQHKRYHAVLTLLSEIQHRGWAPLPPTNPRANEVNRICRERLAEFGSDLGSALFAWIHGSYKNARLILRSSIENLLKAVGIVEHDDIVRVRNTYEVFDLAESLPFFGRPANKSRMRILRDNYSVLSMDVHTATEGEMENVGALSFFPRFSPPEADEFANLYVRTVSTSLEIVCLMFPRFIVRCTIETVIF